MTRTIDAGLTKPVRVESAVPTMDADLVAAFDAAYRNAAGNASAVPWHRDGPNAPLVWWQNHEAPGLVRPGGRVAVVGCGLGDDVAEIEGRGYDVVGLDVSSTAIEWARTRHAACADRFVIADTMSPPSRLRARFDLVVEVYTLQSLPISLREPALVGVASLMKPHGTLLVICRGRCESEPCDAGKGPPYPISRPELEDLAARQGLSPLREIEEFMDGETPQKRRLRVALRRA
jgi:SAM-dependent methyltransferase